MTIMNRHSDAAPGLPRTPFLADRVADGLGRFLHIEAVSGAVLLLAAALALIWANSPLAASYHALWEAPLSLGIGSFVFSRPLHFWVNDGLMTFFFLVVGMEVRNELHDGALSQPRQAALPVLAAMGGVVAPALIFLALNSAPAQRHGWAVPTATDIAFAVGVLALLGRGVPTNVRVILLTIAIIDDIIAVLIIALFYSGGLAPAGFLVAGMGALVVLAFQRAGLGSAWAYVAPGAIVWGGLMMSGAHPALAGVVLGLMTPVRALWRQAAPERVVARVVGELADDGLRRHGDERWLAGALRQLRGGTREILPPVVRVQLMLRPWVAYVVMPLFALANAGVAVNLDALGSGAPAWIMGGVAVALVLGKPLGIMAAVWGSIRLGWCRLPPGVGWGGVLLVGLLTGIGFTMSIFVALLAYAEPVLLDAARLGVLTGSLCAALLGLAWGSFYLRQFHGSGEDAPSG